MVSSGSLGPQTMTRPVLSFLAHISYAWTAGAEDGYCRTNWALDDWQVLATRDVLQRLADNLRIYNSMLPSQRPCSRQRQFRVSTSTTHHVCIHVVYRFIAFQIRFDHNSQEMETGLPPVQLGSCLTAPVSTHRPMCPHLLQRMSYVSHAGGKKSRVFLTSLARFVKSLPILLGKNLRVLGGKGDTRMGNALASETGNFATARLEL